MVTRLDSRFILIFIVFSKKLFSNFIIIKTQRGIYENVRYVARHFWIWVLST